jgi:hypothetical protein
VSPANEPLLVLGILAVDDEPVDEALQEDGGGAGASETATGVAQVHSAGRGRERRSVRRQEKKGRRERKDGGKGSDNAVWFGRNDRRIGKG